MMLRAARIAEAAVNPDKSVTICLEEEDNGVIDWLLVVDLPPERASVFAKAVVGTLVWGGNGYLLLPDHRGDTKQGAILWAEPVDKCVIRLVEKYRRDHWTWEAINAQ